MNALPSRLSRSSKGAKTIVFLALSVFLALGAALTLGSTASSRPARPVQTSASDRLSEAKVAFADRDYARAESLLKEHLEANPGEAKAKLLLGRVFLVRGRLVEARDLLSSVLKADPRDPEATRGVGEVYRQMGQLDVALTYFTRATELDPKNPEVWKERGLLERQKGDALGALSSLQESLTLDPKQGDLSHLLSQIGTSLQESAQAARGLAQSPLMSPPGTRLYDVDSLGLHPAVPDPTQHFPKPAGRVR